MKMFIGGEWTDRDDKLDVLNPFDGSVVDTVPKATPEDVARAVATAEQGAAIMRDMPAYERYQILHRASRIMEERLDDLGRTITLEEGKILPEGLGEAARSLETITLSAEEAKRLTGETLGLDGASNGAGKFGFTLRIPVGIVAAITPFNFPLNLVCHKVGPALAAGNAVIVKPASDTPLSALKLTEILLEAGVPPQAIQCITGSGALIGHALATDLRIRKISFTGSRDVGEHICQSAGIKKVTMELGSNSPVIVMDDADLEKVAAGTASSGFANAGQVCISAQRLLVEKAVYTDFIDALKTKVEGLTTGNPLNDGIGMGPMIRESDAIRVNEWIGQAVDGGARLVTGGERDGTMHQPTVVADVDPGMRISCDEIFGPAVAVTPVDDIDMAIKLANATNYGLSASIFTESIDRALKFAQQVHSGNLHINWGTQWRADMMPYGGVKDSGMGKEGPKYAIEEMTETKMVVFH
ncbi:MAG: aldehyde dehydrogenase family protein [Gemmatimonadetes bacterium]|jgi:glyceraldehyde-3-phosphate dehydrogenase (NADP+)|nr:aldehyde dehydrogenase family protein [Gemmatimonadota bacterium]MBT5058721.1 aldehyde dehydrogenase family protein [Gemmatimonadota bacterium]MBT5146593.1 aldehyde dehydrogenase family protein [Gemmatimonadota bacterium]MBT5587243.1 aldehyde dehydrogenase family protein [Gemmatimonadota bacterium]MBT5961343.1 aldehyde dehydrogenase family protein [Gemmatimonadota bacterium]